MSNFSDVGNFHRKFGLEHVSRVDEPAPREVTDECRHFRRGFLIEELTEFFEAHGLILDTMVFDDPEYSGQVDHAKAFDSLLDLVYVAMGTAHVEGYPWEQGWDEVQRANMSKIRAEREDQSKRGSTFDVVKPQGWRAPDIEGLLDEFGWPRVTPSDSTVMP